MERILEELYSGDLQPAEQRDWDNPEYEEKCRESVRKIEQFSRRLDRETREAFDDVMEHYLELCYIEKAQAFSDGFRIGSRIMWEVFGREIPGQHKDDCRM